MAAGEDGASRRSRSPKGRRLIIIRSPRRSGSPFSRFLVHSVADNGDENGGQ